MANSSYIDWQPFLDEHIFSKESGLNILEFGLGYGTEYFLQKGNTVHSVEILSSIQDSSWFDAMKNKYQNASWSGSFVQLQGEIDSIQINERRNRIFDITKSPMIQTALKDVILPYFQEDTYDFIFVDPGIHLRAEIVNLCFETQAKYIATHDTSMDHTCYGWAFIQPPPNYQRIQTHYGMGTTLFIKND
jgi:hypothetical protein